MALRDRQVSGIPLTRMQSELISHAMTALVPLLGYKVWYPWLGIPKELWLVLAVLSTAAHLAMSVAIVPNNVERNLLWFGTYTGASFPNGICFLPRLPFPLILIALRVILGEEIYRKILWSLEGDVSIQSITIPFFAQGLARVGERGGVRVGIQGMLRLEVANAATYLSQTAQGVERLHAFIASRYEDSVKAGVIAQHTPMELMRGYHSASSVVLREWMAEQWGLLPEFGLEFSDVSLTQVNIASKDVEHAFDLEQAQETFVGAARTVGEIIAELKRKHPHLSDTEVAMMYSAILKDTGVNVNVHNVNLKQ